jgi:multidrug resistance efflux pump
MERPKIGQGNWIYFAALLGILALAGGGGYYVFREYQKPKVELAAPAPAANADAAAMSYQGKIRAAKTLPIPAPIDGTLEELSVADGEEVSEGQLLARITNSTLELAKQEAAELLEQARTKLEGFESQLIGARLEISRASADLARVKAEYETASRAFERQKVLFREGAAAKRTYDATEAAFRKIAEERSQLEDGLRSAETRAAGLQKNAEEARAKLTEATAEQEDADAEALTGQVLSPVTGLLVNHKKNAGDQVTRDIADLFEIAVDLTAMEVVVDLTAGLTGRVSAGQAALVQVAEAGPQPLEGKVREVKEGQAYVEFVSPSPAIRPGMTAQVRFLLNPVR